MRSASIQGPINLETPSANDNWIDGDTIRMFNGTSALLPSACAFCRETHKPQLLPASLPQDPAQGFQLKLILPGVDSNALRSYEDSPGALPGAVNQLSGPSPLRVGDSFEKMKSKMVPFERPPPGPSGVTRAAHAHVLQPENNTPRAAGPAAAATTPLTTPLVPGVPMVVNTPGGDTPIIGGEISVQPALEA